MEAIIVHVMESWPLQLVLQTATGQEHGVLAEKVSIQRSGGVSVEPGALRPGQRIRVLTWTSRGEIAKLQILD